MNKMLDEKQKLQEEQYGYPYHYIPNWENGFSQNQYWSWGFRYLGGLKVALDLLQELKFDSLLDIGCGDGRFLYEVNKKYKVSRLLGVDYSQKSILLAKAMTNDLVFENKNILKEPIDYKYDIITAIEVLEHIHPSDLSQFLKTISNSIDKNGSFILTVPHINKIVSNKHYQHFSSSKLEKLLSPFFSEINFIPFDTKSYTIRFLQKLLGGMGENFVITNSKINQWFFKLYINRYLYPKDEERCLRIAAICQK